LADIPLGLGENLLYLVPGLKANALCWLDGGIECDDVKLLVVPQ
jgi:hypothetical protein